ncbi:hypothetical protein B0H17DRAFT_914638, partial [Mycena rosella]
MVKDALAAARTQEEENVVYYGPILDASPPLSVYTASSCAKAGRADAKAGCGVYWGESNHRNKGAPVPGGQSDARAALYAITLAILTAPTYRTLTVYSPSQYAIRSFCYWVGENATRGWPCKHADIIRVGAEYLRARRAAVSFCWVDKSQGSPNMHLASAQALAKSAA